MEPQPVELVKELTPNSLLLLELPLRHQQLHVIRYSPDEVHCFILLIFGFAKAAERLDDKAELVD